MSSISGKTALITGGASGIGLGMAKAMLARGAARVVLWDINADALKQATDELTAAGGHVTADLVDVTSPVAREAAAQRLADAGKV
ncbi:MAG: SDR family NAD(P)-dependent oxidoreductase, partial [Rhodothermales bacterium]|nr:SDR family NAD(P)-dependent oxidoreductase [Rhodothermales bacterium]